MIWLVILTTVMLDGSVYTEVRVPNSPKFNDEASCNVAGQAIVDQKQLEIGTKTGTVYFVCSPITKEQIDKATNKTSL